MFCLSQMIIDGNKINNEIAEDLKKKVIGRKLSLAIVFVGDDPVSARYIDKKKKFGEEIGVEVRIFRYGAGILTRELISEIRDILADNPSGIIVQLPLPKNIDSSEVLNILPVDKDVDLLSDFAQRLFVEGRSRILPPVVGSVKEILDINGMQDLQGLRAVVVGRGKLVGRPVEAWLKNQGCEVAAIDKVDWNPDISSVVLSQADIVVSGPGVPNLIKPEMIRSGAIIIDASTVDVSGKIVGDVDVRCADKARVFSPVPGGVGPITVAMLFKNLVMLGGL